MKRTTRSTGLAIAFLGLTFPASLQAAPPFRITVVDAVTGRGVPLVELRTVNEITYATDSAGVVAFDEPALMGREVFFHVRSHGYEYPKDGFGFRGKRLATRPGGEARLEINRINIAERLYRVTGEGIYRDSLLTGLKAPIRHPELNARVFGSDSVLTAEYQGKLYWFWGDTNRPEYPLGNFHTPGATSELLGKGGLDPEAGVDLDYFVDDRGFAREAARMPGPGPTWLDGLVVLQQHPGPERMFAAYAKVRNWLDIYERGLVEFDDKTKQFARVATFDLHAPALPGGHPIEQNEEGLKYIHFADPYPLVRVLADPEALKQPDLYEAYTCLEAGTRLKDHRIDRGPDGSIRYGWKARTPPVGPKEQAELIKAGRIKPEEALLQLRDVETGQPVMAHRGSVYFNNYSQRWVMIAVETGGTSPLGEVWFAEAPRPIGPWVYARKVATHEHYSFYNPKQHPYFAREGGRVIFFEGTYSVTFSGNPNPTPRYDYNQLMYRLDLGDPRLALPVPIRMDDDQRLHAARDRQEGPDVRGPIAFFAPDRPAPGTLPVVETGGNGEPFALAVGTPSQPPAGLTIFHALPPKTENPPKTTVPLYEYVHEDGKRRAYAVEGARPMPGYRRSERPICLVWRDPMSR